MALLFVLAGCATQSLNYSELEKGSWQGRASVTDKSKDQSVALTLSIKAVRMDRFRMDITTPNGYYVGSVILNDGNFQALVAKEKKFYRGKASASAMNHVLRVPINPEWLPHLVFEQKIEGWNCDRSGSFLDQCVNAEKNITAKIEGRSGSNKTVLLEGPNFSARIFLNSYKKEIPGEKTAFQLSPPKGFRVFRVQ